MKKIYFLILPFLFMSCDSFIEHDVTITNDSSFTVAFSLEKYPSEPSRTLASGESITLELYDHPRLDFGTTPPRVDYTSGVDKVKIFNKTVYSYLLQNLSDVELRISERDGMLGDSFGDTIVLAANKSETVSVYTNAPHFTAVRTDTNADMTDFVKHQQQ